MPKAAAEWIYYNKQNVEELVKQLRSLPVTQAELAVLLKWNESSLSKALSAIKDDGNKWKAISKDRYETLIDHFVKFLPGSEGFFSTDLAYLGLGRLHGLTEPEVVSGLSLFGGTFASYRYSHLLRDRQMVLRGLTEFSTSDKKDRISVRSFYKIQADILAQEVTFERTGYLIPKLGNRATITSFKIAPIRDEEHIFVYKSTPYGSGPMAAQILRMHGHIVDWEQSDFYATNIYCERENVRTIEKDGATFCKAFNKDDPEIHDAVTELKRSVFVPLNDTMIVARNKDGTQS